MSESLLNFVERYAGWSSDGWTKESVEGMAGSIHPDAVMGSSWDVIRGDAQALWARWFVASLIHPSKLASQQSGSRIEVVRAVNSAIDERFSHMSKGNKVSLAGHLVDLARQEIARRRPSNRTGLSRLQKLELLDAAGDPPRCWICGYAFSQSAISRYTEGGKAPIQLPEIVDFVRPAGLFENDLTIHIDHVTPVKFGGGEDDNLKLACGWCNGAKREHGNLYEVSTEGEALLHPKLGLIDLPQKFWTVRILAIRQECQHMGPQHCTSTVHNAQLRISPRSSGSFTPPNLTCYCNAHDPLASDRFITPAAYFEGLQKAKRWYKSAYSST